MCVRTNRGPLASRGLYPESLFLRRLFQPNFDGDIALRDWGPVINESRSFHVGASLLSCFSRRNILERLEVDIWFIWRDGAGAGGREREVQGSEGGGGWESGRDLGRGRPQSTGDDGTLKQTPSLQNQPYYGIKSLYDACALIWA